MTLEFKTYRYIISILSIILSFQVYSQDTLKVGNTYEYSSKEVKELSGKGFLGKYGQENILFSENHTKVEFCYYNENERVCYGYNFKISNDSILTILDSKNEVVFEEWTFRKIDNNKYFVYRFKKGFLESGKVDTLIPLRQVEPFVTTTLNKQDTLWSSDYFTCVNRKYGYYYADFTTSKVKGKIYNYDKVETIPCLLNGDSLPKVEIKSIHPCYCEPLTMISTISFIVTKDGKIKNVEQAFGNISDYCAYTMMDINRLIYNWGEIKPATINGEPVNVRWFLNVNNLSQPKAHPAFLDTKQNRKEFIKRKKRFANKG